MHKSESKIPKQNGLIIIYVFINAYYDVLVDLSFAKKYKFFIWKLEICSLCYLFIITHYLFYYYNFIFCVTTCKKQPRKHF